MAKLTKQQTSTIKMSLEALYRARDYILDPKHHIVVDNQYTTMFPADTWTNGEGVRAVSINKEIGSNLAGLYSGISTLERLISYEESKS